MDGITTGIVAGGMVGTVGMTKNAKDLKDKKKTDDNKKVERREGGML